jgi:uncharacterized protein (DUF302 family)
MMTDEIGFEVHVSHPYDKALELTIDALGAEGFGVMTSIDVRATMKEKLDIDFKPYSILGACNPSLAHRVLSQDSVAGLLLPCNVTVEGESEYSATVRIANPQVILGVGSLSKNAEIKAVSEEALVRLESAAEALATA